MASTLPTPRSLIILSSILSIAAALSNNPTANSNKMFSVLTESQVQWDVYVDQSRSAVARGSTTTLDAFVGLSPPSVQVHPVVIASSSRTKSPVVRCASRADDVEKFLEVTNVDTVDKVFRILTRHLKVKGVSPIGCECIKWKHKGNTHLEKGETTLAIEAYDNALSINYREQEGIVLMMRASAYLQRAATHKTLLKQLVVEHTKSVPDTSKFYTLYQQAGEHPILAPSIFQKIESYTRLQETTFRGIKYRHGLYQFAVLHAVQDSLRATQLLPQSERSWLVAADSLSEMWKLTESIQYYRKAADLDPGLEAKILPEIERLQNRQQLLDNARAYGWSEDMLRLALDVGKVDE